MNLKLDGGNRSVAEQVALKPVLEPHVDSHPPHPRIDENISSRWVSIIRWRVWVLTHSGSDRSTDFREIIYQRSLVKCFSTKLFDCGLSNCYSRLAFACFILTSSITRLFTCVLLAATASATKQMNIFSPLTERKKSFFIFFVSLKFLPFKRSSISLQVFCVLLRENLFIWIGRFNCLTEGAMRVTRWLIGVTRERFKMTRTSFD